MYLDDLERLQAESRFNSFLNYLRWRSTCGHRVLGARICLGLDYFKWSSNTEVESQISLRVIGECELAGDSRRLFSRDSPLLDLDLLPSIEAVRLVDA